MNTPVTSVGPLDKVHLQIKAVPGQGNKTSEPANADVVLIYGIGSAGISPFEKMLHAKSVGDAFSLPVEPGADGVIFGHLHCSLTQTIQMAPPYTLHITVASVTPAPAQEVIRAMAQTTGCGGGCGCGCGGH